MSTISITSFSPELHAHTPTLSSFGHQGFLLRTVQYCRSEVGAVAEARIERNDLDAAQRIAAQWDARLWAKAQAGEHIKPNLRSIHDLGGRVLASDSVDAGWQCYLFGAAGNELETWDSRGNRRATLYDELLRPVAVNEQAPVGDEHCVERLTYGGADHWQLNGYGQLIRHDDSAGTIEISAFGLTGQALGQTRRFLTNLDTPHWPDSESMLEPKENSSAWTYDAFGAQLTQMDAGGHTQQKTFTIDGQLKSVSLQISGEDEQVLVSDIEYDACGNATCERHGNNITHNARYSASSNYLLNLRAHREDGSLVQDSVYDHDPVGNVIRFEDKLEPVKYFANQRTDGICTYHYDTLGQLLKATGRKSTDASIAPGLPQLLPLTAGGDTSVLVPYTQTYSYDMGGNLLELRHPGSNLPTRHMAMAPNSNRSLLRSEEGSEPDFGTGFDAPGNMQFLSPGQPMEWDVRNQLKRVVQVRRPDAIDDDERYIYDADNSRSRKIRTSFSSGMTHVCEVRYLPGIEMRTHTATDESMQVINISLGRSQVRVLHWPNNNPPEGIDNNQVRYQIGDYLNSVALELGASAQVISREGYFPFGGTAWHATRSEIEAHYKVIRYSGQERDATGLIYYGYRYYAPWLARWANPDPAGITDGLNLYRMVRNNPLTLKDVGGLGPLDDVRYLNYLNNLHLQNPGISLDLFANYLVKEFPQSAGDAKRIAAQYKEHAQAVQRGKPPLLKFRDLETSEALDYIWATNAGSQYIKGSNEHRNLESEVLRELRRNNEQIFHRKESLESKIKGLLRNPTKLAELFENKIQDERKLISGVFRGMQDIGFAAAAKAKHTYSPGFPLAASTSESVAKEFSRGGVILEIVGMAAPIENVYDRGNEQEYVFSKKATFNITDLGNKRFKLTQIKSNPAK